MTHQATLAQWHESLAKAVADRALDAVPVILVRMARDGWGHEAETARRLLLQPPPALGALLGHDVEAARQLAIVRQAYQAGGLDVLRATAASVVRMAAPDALTLLLVEAVLTIEEHGPDAARVAEEAAFDRAEAADEAAAVRRGGNR